ncbi:Myb_DNA-binding domain-containing protein, partial [Cephalotus follicularis]
KATKPIHSSNLLKKARAHTLSLIKEDSFLLRDATTSISQKMQRRHDYVEALEEEKRKIQVFQRELPLCLELVTQAIEACKRELSSTTTECNMQGQTHLESLEDTSSEGPVLEEFIPLKRNQLDEPSSPSHKQHKSNSGGISDNKKKSDWLRSVQLWNQSPDPPSKGDVPRRSVKINGGAFQPFQKERSVGKSNESIHKKVNSRTVLHSATTSSSSGNSQREEKETQANRKQRRCWSPELHRRFVHALQQLGGSHAATPKQIRELMKVDGLTNDEVKSHLQKYRLHTRRPSQTVHSNSNSQAPQFVVVGGIWVSPPEYAAATTTTVSGEAAGIAAANRIYVPVAAAPAKTQQAPTELVQKAGQAQSEHFYSEERRSHSAEGANPNSPATSSSTHTSTASPVSQCL